MKKKTFLSRKPKFVWKQFPAFSKRGNVCKHNPAFWWTFRFSTKNCLFAQNPNSFHRKIQRKSIKVSDRKIYVLPFVLITESQRGVHCHSPSRAAAVWDSSAVTSTSWTDLRRRDVIRHAIDNIIQFAFKAKIKYFCWVKKKWEGAATKKQQRNPSIKKNP